MANIVSSMSTPQRKFQWGANFKWLRQYCLCGPALLWSLWFLSWVDSTHGLWPPSADVPHSWYWHHTFGFTLTDSSTKLLKVTLRGFPGLLLKSKWKPSWLHNFYILCAYKTNVMLLTLNYAHSSWSNWVLWGHAWGGVKSSGWMISRKPLKLVLNELGSLGRSSQINLFTVLQAWASEKEVMVILALWATHLSANSDSKHLASF